MKTQVLFWKIWKFTENSNILKKCKGHDPDLKNSKNQTVVKKQNKNTFRLAVATIVPCWFNARQVSSVLTIIQ
jgi:hypothetical protein